MVDHVDQSVSRPKPIFYDSEEMSSDLCNDYHYSLHRASPCAGKVSDNASVSTLGSGSLRRGCGVGIQAAILCDNGVEFSFFVFLSRFGRHRRCSRLRCPAPVRVAVVPCSAAV